MDKTVPDPTAVDFVDQLIRWALENGKAFAVGSLLLLGLLLMISLMDRHRDEPGPDDRHKDLRG